MRDLPDHRISLQWNRPSRHWKRVKHNSVTILDARHRVFSTVVILKFGYYVQLEAALQFGGADRGSLISRICV